MRDEVQLLNEAANIADRVARILMSEMQYPEFGIGAPTIAETAKILDKDACFVREGIEKGWLPIGICRVGKNRRDFYISPKKLWEVTGYVWKGRETK